MEQAAEIIDSRGPLRGHRGIVERRPVDALTIGDVGTLALTAKQVSWVVAKDDDQWRFRIAAASTASETAFHRVFLVVIAMPALMMRVHDFAAEGQYQQGPERESDQ